jgi:hypothetical protein
MARTLKGTRARGLPPKVLLSQRQDTTGSFPTIWRTSSDNRTGRYPVFFNDNKVVQFNQPVSNVGISVTTYPEYEEKVVTIGSLGNPVNQSNPIAFDYLFSGTPFVVLTELTPNPNTPTVNAFIDVLSFSGMTIKFSAPFEGTIVYRALFQSSPGNPVNVLRSPRYTNQYSLVVVNGAVFDTNNILGYPNTADITFSDFGSAPTENYVTFYDFYTNNQANISSSISVITNTSVQVTGSAPGDVVLFYMGAGSSTASIDVSGIVYPLVMTPQAINVDLSTEAKSDLYKQPYFSGSAIVNQPIVASGSMKKGVSDIFVTFTPGQDIEPFEDFANPEVDAKISNVTSSNYEFFATGSLVETTGLGFQQPLWSKNKIEIDITPAVEQTFTLYKSASVGSYPMGYWNPITKLYEGIGTGKGIDSYSGNLNGLKKALDEQTFGFNYSIDGGGTITGLTNGEQFNLYGRQTNIYGFPYHPKFQPTSSQQILAANLISEPFLLEKIVLELSGAVAFSAVASNPTATWTFFLLNSRNIISGSQSKSQNINYLTGSTNSYSQFTTSSILNGNILDVIDSIQICLSTSRDLGGYLQREQLISAWSGITIGETGSFQFAASSSVKSPLSYDSGLITSFSGALGSYYMALEQKLSLSGRNQYYEVNGREWDNSFENPQIIRQGTFSIGLGTAAVNINNKYTKPNPYILLPTDKLTFGFQLPYQNTNNIASNTFVFSPQGINKIILYGSTLRLNPETNQLEEYHDTLNQLVSSTSIHEVIGE